MQARAHNGVGTLRALCGAIALVIWTSLSPATQAETLRAATTGNLVALLNPFSALVQGIVNPHPQIHDSLFVVATDGTLEPGLALEAEPISETVWRIHLRPNVVYSNGRPFTAEAVVKTIDYLQSDAARRFVISGETRKIKSIRAADDLTLEVETTAPDVLLPRRFGTILMPDPWLYEELGPEEFSLAPVGTGSYVVDDWNLSAQTPILKANRESWRPPLTFHTIELRIVKDAATQIQALLTGEVDIGYNFGVIELDLLRANGFNITTRPGGQVTSIALSNLREDSPFQDQRVRQAINYAVDKRAISDIIMLGTTTPAGQPGVPGMTGFNPDVEPYPYDPVKSRELLRAAGYEDGFAFRADVLIAGGVVEAATMYQKIAQDLAAVGIQFEPHPVQGAQWIAKYFSGEWGEADAISATWNGASYWDVIRAIEIFSCNKPTPFFCVPEMMPRIDATHGMFDPAKRERALQALSKEVHDLAPSLFLVPLVDVVAASGRLGPLHYRHKQLAMEKLTLAE